MVEILVGESAERGNAMASSRRVLIVEDDALQAENLRILLAQEGYEIVGIANECVAALTMAHQQRPDLAVVDVHLLGDLDGITTARQMFEQYGIPIVFLTAFVDEAVQQGREFASGFLNKPYSRQDLSDVVQHALQ